jgi:hypothetical protein
MPKLIILSFLFTLSSLLLSAQPPIPPDTLVSVFHHNYLVERHVALQQFADELVAYSSREEVSEEIRKGVLFYRNDVYDTEVWKSEDVINTKNKLDYLLSQGTRLRNEMVGKEIDREKKVDWQLWQSLAIMLILGVFYSLRKYYQQ